MPFIAPLSVTPEELDARAQAALLCRRDLWAVSDESSRAACDARNEVDGSALCRVPAGITWVGDAGRGAPLGAKPIRRVTVPAFELQKGEVTVGQYARCAKAGACKPVDLAQTFCHMLLDAADKDSLPMPCVSYADAVAYCHDAKMELPTDAQWTRAGRGDTAIAYAWGDAWSPAARPLRGNFGEKLATGYPDYSTVPDGTAWLADGYRGLAAPCRFPDGNSAFGVCDLAGNLAEWVHHDERALDVARGGSWLDAEPGALRVGASIESSRSTSGTRASSIECSAPPVAFTTRIVRSSWSSSSERRSRPAMGTCCSPAATSS